MSALIVIQARMGSTRLPGKVMAELDGRPMLAFQLARLSTLRDAEVVVATSDLARDGAIAHLAEQLGVACIRGPEQDVLTRFRLALDAHPADVVVRLTADCPLTDPTLVAAAKDALSRTGADYAGNTPIRTFPDGLDVEAMTAEALLAADADATDPVDREHVTRFLLRHPERFRLVNLRAPDAMADERWTVDTATDLARVREIVGLLAHPLDAGWAEILAVAGTTVPSREDVVQARVVADLTVESLLETTP